MAPPSPPPLVLHMPPTTHPPIVTCNMGPSGLLCVFCTFQRRQEGNYKVDLCLVMHAETGAAIIADGTETYERAVSLFKTTFLSNNASSDAGTRLLLPCMLTAYFAGPQCMAFRKHVCTSPSLHQSRVKSPFASTSVPAEMWPCFAFVKPVIAQQVHHDSDS